MHFFRKRCVFALTILLVVTPFVAPATEVFTTPEYVVKRYQATTSGGTTTTHQYDMMQVNSTGYLERVTPANSISSSSNGSKLPATANAVYDYAIKRPSSTANGKVLTYTGTNTATPAAQYIKVPVASGDPNASGASAPSGFASIWLQ